MKKESILKECVKFISYNETSHVYIYALNLN